MSIQSFSRCGVVLFLVAFISGCSLAGLDVSDIGNKCKWNPSSCMHEGQYEPDEEDYAEEEAKRLNRAASAKLRRNSIK